MTQVVPSATSGTQTLPLVAGMDLLTPREHAADRIAHTLTSEIGARCGTDITVATHPVQVGELRHIALSIESIGVDRGLLWELLCDVSQSMAGGGKFWAQGAGVVLEDRFCGPLELRGPLEAVVASHQARASGRVVVFGGSEGLTGTMSVRRVLACSAIDRIKVLAAGEAHEEALLVTREFVRPRWFGGQLVLDTQPAAGGTLVPFETPFPTPCCPNHA